MRIVVQTEIALRCSWQVWVLVGMRNVVKVREVETVVW